MGARYTRDQMSALLKHTQTTDIEDREKIIMTGVLSLKAKKIRDVMTNLIDVFMLEANRIVDDELVLNVHGYGYSRIPVYEGRRFGERSEERRSRLEFAISLSETISSAW